MISLNNISFSYNSEKQILNNISFSSERAETIGIVGASGCGKSTLLRIISGILPESKNHQLGGQISIDGLSPDDYRKTGNLSFMFQDPTLMPNRTVKGNIQLPLEVSGKSNNKKVDDLLKMIGLSEFADYLPKQLSGGMRTRVSLARSFITEPELLLLDEPFSALDISWKSKLYVELEQLKKRFNSSIILVTHDIQEALILCDKIITLNSKGNIIGSPKRIESSIKVSERAYRLSDFLSEVFTRYYIPIQKLIADDGTRANTHSDEAMTALESLISIAGDLDKENQFISGSHKQIRKYSHQEDFNEKLLTAFHKAKTNRFKHELIWDILNYPELPIDIHEKLLSFYLGQIDEFSKKSIKFLASSEDTVFDALIGRVNDITIPKSKKWVYLCDMYGSSERERVIDYLDQVIDEKISMLNDEFIKSVANKVKHLLVSDNVSAK